MRRHWPGLALFALTWAVYALWKSDVSVLSKALGAAAYLAAGIPLLARSYRA